MPWQGHFCQTSLPRAPPDVGHSHFSGQPVPGPHHLHCEDICPYIQPKPTFFYYPLSYHYTSMYKVPLQLPVGPFRSWKAAIRCPPRTFSSPGWRTPTLSASLHWKVLQPYELHAFLLVGLLEPFSTWAGCNQNLAVIGARSSQSKWVGFFQTERR